MAKKDELTTTSTPAGSAPVIRKFRVVGVEAGLIHKANRKWDLAALSDAEALELFNLGCSYLQEMYPATAPVTEA